MRKCLKYLLTKKEMKELKRKNYGLLKIGKIGENIINTLLLVSEV